MQARTSKISTATNKCSNTYSSRKCNTSPDNVECRSYISFFFSRASSWAPRFLPLRICITAFLFLDERGALFTVFANLFNELLCCREERSEEVSFIVDKSIFSLQSMLSFAAASCCLASSRWHLSCHHLIQRERTWYSWDLHPHWMIRQHHYLDVLHTPP